MVEAAASITWSGYSLAERDRRWEAVRRGAADAGLDCIFVPAGNALDARYLTQLPSAAVVLPTDDRPPIAVTDRGAGNDWVANARAANRRWAEPMAEALIEAGMERAKIGVAGLQAGKLSHVRAMDGVVNHGAYAHVVQALPNATFVDATDVVGYARYVKSDEEIACLQRGTDIAEAGVETMIASSRPGVDAAVWYGAVMDRMLGLGSEYYALAFYMDPIDGPRTQRYTNPALGRSLQPNDLITNEVSAVWGGIVAQEDQPIVLGPVPEQWKPVIEFQREVFEAGLAYMKPGTAFGDFIDQIHGFKKDGMTASVLMHGRGLGDDGPLLTPRAAGEEIREVRIEKGNAWVWKPTTHSADGRIDFTWGGDVVVTESGGKALFKRPHGMTSVS